MNQKISQALGEMQTHKGESLKEMTDKQPVLIAFLRHLGCVFCMEAMKDIEVQRNEIESRNVSICLVHMGDPTSAEG